MNRVTETFGLCLVATVLCNMAYSFETKWIIYANNLVQIPSSKSNANICRSVLYYCKFFIWNAGWTRLVLTGAWIFHWWLKGFLINSCVNIKEIKKNKNKTEQRLYKKKKIKIISRICTWLSLQFSHCTGGLPNSLLYPLLIWSPIVLYQK